jgi:predicted nucleic acid-binding protein
VRADYRVILDACVLIPMPLADTLLRMAEAPRLYLPRWSQLIMHEVTRNLIQKWKVEPARAYPREEQIRRHFPEAQVEGFESLVAVMTNDPKDRHVLAAAVRSHSELIVTYNQRDFPPASVQPGKSMCRDLPHSCVDFTTLTPGCLSKSCISRRKR